VSGDVNYSLGSDLIAFVCGGAADNPILTVINLVSHRGTRWLGADQGPALVTLVRKFLAAS
jgi:hypothetical protein